MILAQYAVVCSATHCTAQPHQPNLSLPLT